MALYVVDGFCPPVVREEAHRRGWRTLSVGTLKDLEGTREEKDGEDAGGRLFVAWKNKRFLKSELKVAQETQVYRCNHFPHTFAITKKDLLVRNLRQMKGTYRKAFPSFFPQAFLLPTEYTKFVRQYSKDDEEDKRSLWICKPNDLSRGRKIFLIQDLSELRYDQECILQRYVPNPLTLGGYKVDLRVYALVTSMHPLRVYVYRNGLARFGTEKYEGSKLDNIYAHLTNTSINKNSKTYSEDKDVIGSGAKWDFEQLSMWIDGNNNNNNNSGDNDDGQEQKESPRKSFKSLWHDICDIIILTLLSATQSKKADLRESKNFELFGFDILPDQRLKPHLLEVNCAPSLAVDCEEDMRVKEPLVRDLFTVLQEEADQFPKQKGNQHPKPREEARRYLPRRKPPLDTSTSSTTATITTKTNSARDDSYDLLKQLDTGEFDLVFPFSQACQDVSQALVAESFDLTRTSPQAYAKHFRTLLSLIKKRASD